MNKRLLGVLFLLPIILLFYPPITAWAQQEVMMVGQDSDGNSRIVKIDSTGRLQTRESGTHGACTNGAMTVGGSSEKIPATPRADRGFVTVQLNTSGQTLTCELDGAAVDDEAGLILSYRDIASFTLSGTVDLTCSCSTPGCNVRYMECP